jgi:hypothetical protein
MNPLYRRMFQQPGMSRQPMGILASSPELANVAAQRQPVRMAQGGDVGLQKVVSQLEALKQSGDVDSLKRVANDPNSPGLVRRIASNFADSLLPGSVPLIQVGDVNLSNALSDATNRSPIGQSVGGQQRSAAITPQVDVTLGNALSDFSGRKPIGQSVGGQERSAALRNAPSKIMDGLSSGLDKVGIGLTDVGQKISDAFTVSPSPGVGTYRSPKEKQADVKNRLSKVFGFRGLLRPEEEIMDFEANMTSSNFDSGLYDDIQTTTDFEGGVATGLPLTSAEELAAPVGPGEAIAGSAVTKPEASTDNRFDVNKKKAIGTQAGSTTANKAINTITDKLTALLSGDVKDSNVMKTTVPASQANNPDAAGAFAETYNAYSDPTEVDLAKVDDAIDQMFGDKKDFTKAKKDAFYMNLIKAGLAIAAGESSNAMTNIAKGLSFGLEGYGKDIKDFNEQEREDEKERRVTRFQMIRDERTANIAMAANKNQWSAAQNTLRQNRDQFNTELDYKKAKDATDMAFAKQSIAINLIPKIAQLEISGATLDEQTRSNMATEALNEFKNEPKLLQVGKRLGLFDDKNQPTQKAIDLYGDEFEKIIMDAQIAETRGTTAKVTDQDKVTASLQRLSAGTGDDEDRARVLASSAGQAAIKDAGGDINEALKIMFANLKPKFAVGQVVEQGGKKFRVTAVDNQGQPTASEEVK